jgi:hypothetical protein
VNGDCYGICCYHGKLVVAYCDPAKLQILDMNGTILITIDDENIFNEPNYVKCNSSSIYVSDSEMKSVSKLNWQGDVIDSYSGMGEPRGISLSDMGNGTVFMCDWERNVIEEISGDCATGKVALQDVIDPYAVCWSEGTKKLYFSCYTSNVNKKYDLLYIYKLS